MPPSSAEPVFNPGVETYGYHHHSAAAELSQFLLKKELLLTRLTKYNDRPESYAVWKAAFRSIMSDLNVTPNEELDLMVKYLGPESSTHATSLRVANVNSPERALKRLWDRLNERYGCPEMVEAALKIRLANFPKLTIKDSRKLYELSDIVSEIEATMEDERYQSLLAYYNSSSGVIPIVNKLPYSLQETLFAEFLRRISKIRNDPSFAYNQAPSNIDTSNQQQEKTKVSSRKTEVSQDTSTSKQTVDVETHCPMHTTKHPLNQCRSFRRIPLHERKELIRKYGMCYRFCASKAHRANSCTEAQPCTECFSDRHPTALHVATSTSEIFPSAASDGGEESVQNSPSFPVKTTCTQICGNAFSGKSCAKTMLVRVYPDGKPENAIPMYAIIDDQSNASLAKSEFFDILAVDGQEIPYTLLSCAGSTQTQGRVAKGYIVESLDGHTMLKLPTLLECDQIPNDRNEIPTPDVAQHHTHLKDIAKHIPPLDNDANILLLLCRDLPEAHHVLDQRIGMLGKCAKFSFFPCENNMYSDMWQCV